ncbi:MAG: macro domain-containing protein [Pseudobutyrivibrio sp.]|nr:macro domain-containing protein [Pseudobutyrivibrio sp.]
MTRLSIEKKGITEFATDAIVNAANSRLAPGGGVCGAIFSQAGYDELDDACIKIGRCNTGDAVITPGFNLPAKYIVHAVGPIWQGGANNEPKLLYNAYKNALTVAKENNCKSIAFPLISAGIYGYPLKEAWQVALQACLDFLLEEEIDITFAVLDQKIMEVGQQELQKLRQEEKYKAISC